jgi:DNA polymerase-4/protein ImuB
VETLLGRAFVQPLLRGRYARLATLTGSVSGGTGWTQRVPFREPAGDKGKALFAIKAKLECHPVPGPLEDMQLTMSRLTGDAGRQSSLFVDVRRRENLREAMRQMEASMGRRPPIYQVREMEPWSRIPERRMALVEYAP